MNTARIFFIFLTLLLLCCNGNEIRAQGISQMRGKKHALKGKWQLVSSFSEGKEYAVVKEEYDGTITFKRFHRYVEEVNYESYHWIIKGKWRVYRHQAILSLTQRKYVVGELEKNPADINFELIRLDKTEWQASSTANGGIVKVTYKAKDRKGKSK